MLINRKEKINLTTTVRFIFVLFFCFELQAQTHYVKHFNQANGLTQNTVNALWFDASDKLWILTEDGLAQYNGNAFLTINSNTHTFLKSNRFRWILPTYNKQHWLATADGGLYKISGNDLQVIDTVNTSYAYLTGVIGSLSKLNHSQNNTYSPCQKLFRVYPTPIFSTNDTNFCYTLGKYYLYKHQWGKLLDSIAVPINTNSLVPYANDVYLTGKYGVVKVDLELKQNHKQQLIGASLDGTETWFQDPSSSFIYLKINKYILVLQALPNNTLQVIDRFSIPSDLKGVIKAITYHKKSRLLVAGTLQNGIYLFYPKSIQTINYPDERVDQSGFYAHTLINDSTVLTSDGMECSFNSVKKSKQYVTSELLSTTALVVDKNKVLWCYGPFFLGIQKPGKQIVKIRANNFDKVGKFLAHGDTMFVVMSRKVLAYYKYALVDSIEIPYNPNLKDRNQSNSAIVWSNKLIVSNCGGVFEIALNNLSVVKQISNLVDVSYLYASNDCVFLVQSYHAIWLYYHNSMYRLPIDKLGFLTHAHNVHVSPNNVVSIGTNKGLLTTSYNNIKRFLNDTQNTVSYNYYTTSNGLLNAEFNGGCHTLQSGFKNGWLSFANMGGIVWFNPNLIFKASAFDFNPYITSVHADGLPIAVNDTILLPKGVKRVVFELSAVYWANSNDVSYWYKLDRDNWIELPVQDPNIVFTNLSAGRHILQLKGQVGGIYQLEKTLQVVINREAFVFETLWFKLLLLAFVLASGVWVGWFYTSRLRKRNMQLEMKVQERTQKLVDLNTHLQTNISIKNKLITIISHDIATPLKFISKVISYALISDNQQEQQEVMHEVKSTSSRLYNHSQNLLNWMRYQSEMITPHPVLLSPYVVAERVAELYDEVAKLNHNTIDLTVNMDALVETDEHMLTIMLQNLLANAVNHNQHAKITVYSFENNEYFAIGVKDTGKGIKMHVLRRLVEVKTRRLQTINLQNAESTSLGYLILFDLAHLNRVKLRLFSSADGTNVQLFLNKQVPNNSYQ